MSRQKPIWELVSEEGVPVSRVQQIANSEEFSVLTYVAGTRNAQGHVPQHKVEINGAGNLRCSCQAFRFGKNKGKYCKHITKVLVMDLKSTFLDPDL